MPNLNSVRAAIRDFDVKRVLTGELGWDQCHLPAQSVEIGEVSWKLHAVAQKRGFVVFQCEPSPDGLIPEYATRNKIELKVAKTAFEHMIVYVDAGKTAQVWQWAKKESGKPIQRRELAYHAGHTGEALAQRLIRLRFTLEEEGEITQPEVVARTTEAMRAEKVTKRFYERFTKEHSAFLDFIEGIRELGDREWYASLMLNRMMFVYFIQKKGFLDGDHDYLRNRLNKMRDRAGSGKFHNFYRTFLLTLFHSGLGQQEGYRTPEVKQLLGKIPYLNGGLFDVHQLERVNAKIDIPDEAFERVFDFFDEYDWHLDTRPGRADNEINPDVLGYIFEKYINQKQMGAYYTKEDITGYISRNTIISSLFDKANANCATAFKSDGGVWKLLKENPDRYIYPAVKHGLTWNYRTSEELDKPVPLPADIEAGVAEVGKRGEWNKTATDGAGLPTETWREVIARRQRYVEISNKLRAGDVNNIDDLIKFNLDIERFALDVIEQSEGTDLVKAFWEALQGREGKDGKVVELGISVLDPTCGSGAFLFAALEVLKPLYDACLNTMRGFVEDLDLDTTRDNTKKLSWARQALVQMGRHPSEDYFTYKSIVISNLFGVDIMEEAVEICKLRLFLKLVAQLETPEQIEPLPDIDFNIRPGNTLVGFATMDEVKRVIEGQKGRTPKKLDFGGEYRQIEERAEEVARAYGMFRHMQTEQQMDGVAFVEAKEKLRKRLDALKVDLDAFRSSDYGIPKDKPKLLHEWRTSHQPLHWPADFYAIVRHGGFDVIIGNPPYIELKEIANYEIRGYECIPSGNLYAVIIERCSRLCHAGSRQGFIVPVSSVSTDRYETLRRMLGMQEDCFSSYDDRPSRLFDGLEHIRLTIHLLGGRGAIPNSTRYNKWFAQERAMLFERLEFVEAAPTIVDGSWPKLGSRVEHAILQKLLGQKAILREFYASQSEHRIYYSRKVGYFLQVLDFEPTVLDGRGSRRAPSEFKTIAFKTAAQARLALCCLNSSLFYWFVTVLSDCRHLNKREIDAFPINLAELEASTVEKHLVGLGQSLMRDLQLHSEDRTMRFRHDTLTIQCIYPKHSKPFIDRIDALLAKHYRFAPEELDFIVNYDAKYRMGPHDGEVDR